MKNTIREFDGIGEVFKCPYCGDEAFLKRTVEDKYGFEIDIYQCKSCKKCSKF